MIYNSSRVLPTSQYSFFCWSRFLENFSALPKQGLCIVSTKFKRNSFPSISLLFFAIWIRDQFQLSNFNLYGKLRESRRSAKRVPCCDLSPKQERRPYLSSWRWPFSFQWRQKKIPPWRKGDNDSYLKPLTAWIGVTVEFWICKIFICLLTGFKSRMFVIQFFSDWG